MKKWWFSGGGKIKITENKIEITKLTLYGLGSRKVDETTTTKMVRI
jgi:hypothetical protein